MSWLASRSIWILLPTVSLGKTEASRVTCAQLAECGFWDTFAFVFLCVQLFRVGLGKIRILLWALETMCFPLNFFSNSGTYQTWFFWKDFSWGMRTKIIIAFWPLSTSISLAAVIFSSLSWAFRPELISSSRRAWDMLD